MHDCCVSGEVATSDFDALSIKEVKLKQFPQADKLQVNDQKASIASIIIIIILDL